VFLEKSGENGGKRSKIEQEKNPIIAQLNKYRLINFKG
jgi:hypothetical protein